MPRDLLPPDGIWVPRSILYDKTLPAVVRDTWIRLRGLAWGRTETPPLSIDQICQVFGMSQSTLYGHMLILRDRAACSWRAAGNKTLIVSFEDAAGGHSENLEKPTLSISSLSTSGKKRGNSTEGAAAFQKSGKRQADPRTQHAAVQACRAVVGRYPPKELYDDLIAALGEAPDLERLKTCRKEWVKRYNPNAWTWALEWYRGGLPAHIAKKPTEPASNGAGPWRRGGT
jgi:hypothetical protein